MSHCSELSERMPDVALGRSAWAEHELAHLTSCADCRAEWSIVEAAARMGAAVPGGDASLAGRKLLARLRQARERVRRRQAAAWSVAGLAAAAAVVLALWTGRAGLRMRNEVPVRLPPMPAPIAATPAPTAPPAAAADTARSVPPSAGAPVELALPELDQFDAPALDAMLDLLNDPLAESRAGDLASPDGDADRALERALEGMEG